MAFSSETRILTDRGWQYIRDISGRDRVLVRNFLGDAEFTQPFALKRAWYCGEVIKMGNKDWGLTLTPDHKIVYNVSPNKIGQVPSQITAKDVVPNNYQALFRKFRYNQEERYSERLELKDRSVFISLDDWDIILAFTILFGYIDKRNNPHIRFCAEEEKLLILIDVLDRIGLNWSWNSKSKGNPQISLPNDSNLVSKLRRYLGARARVEMSLPEKAVFKAPPARLRHFISLVLQLGSKPIKERPGQFSFVTCNRKLSANLEMMCMLAGFGCSTFDYGDWGIKMRIIIDPMASWYVRKVEKQQYLGYIYEIDLFDGLVYVTERNLPVWAAAK